MFKEHSHVHSVSDMHSFDKFTYVSQFSSHLKLAPRIKIAKSVMIINACHIVIIFFRPIYITSHMDQM